MSYRWLVVAALVVATLLYCRGPSAKTVVANTRIVVEDGALEFKGKRYAAEWGESVEHQGVLRRFGRARYRYAPFFTHHAVVTTGDYSDPEKVEVTPFRGGSIIWSARTRPEGSLIVLHFVPGDLSVAVDLGRLDMGDCARFTGREETDGEIRADDGSFTRLNSANHRYVLLDRVRPCS